ncbi:MAG: hypothetical protein WCK74_11800, partial [Gemmatimonadaceae bacterium]
MTSKRASALLAPALALTALLATALLATALLATACGPVVRPRADTTSPRSPLTPGTRVLLDAHNSYPERGQWTDRLPRALSTGTPLAIEQDLYWVPYGPGGRWQSVVAHDSDAAAGAPTLDAHFFEALRPLMEQALRENRREQWPLVTL